MDAFGVDLPTMRYLTRRPRLPLGEHVEDLWLYSGYAPPHEFERILPSGTVELVISLSEPELRCYDSDTLELRGAVRGPLVSGVRAGHLVVDTRQQREMVGVHFRPGGAYAVFGLPVDELQNLDLPLEDLWGGSARELEDRLRECPQPERRLEILEEVLAQHLRPNRRLHPAIHQALGQLHRPEESIAIGDLAARMGWSDRHFIQIFKTQVGIAPKTYGRIRRFQTALGRIHRGERRTWSDLALGCGYYDQAHLIRDFREFSGMTPSQYLRLQHGSLEHVPVGEWSQISPLVPVPALGSAAR